MSEKKKYRSDILQRLLDEMENDPWHVKLRRWFRIQRHMYYCLSRKFWDKEFSGYIFKKKK